MVSDADSGGGELEALVRQQAGDECEECSATENLEVYNVGNDNALSLDDLKLLCNSCYEKNHSNKTLTRADILEFHADQDLPFVTVSMVADEFDVSTPTARERLSELVTAGELEQYKHNPQLKFYFKPDYRAAGDVVDGLRDHIELSDLDPEAVEAFARQPYKILPRDEEGEYYVVVPSFLPFSIGHLHDQSDAWRTYVVNKYVKWFSDLPDEISEEISLQKRYEQADLDGDVLEFADEEERDRAWEDFDGQDGPFKDREGDTKIRIQDGKEFEVVADLIDGGNLPFTPSPVDPDDLRSAPPDVTLRDYQEEAWETFKEYGQVGIYWPMSLGKTWFALYVGSRIKGQKLIVVPNSVLQEQWREDINENAPDPEDWDVRTYQYLTHSNGENLEEYQGENAPEFTVFDEHHHIPANKFSQIAMLPTTYRMGLSASPYREDGREEYIFALSGVPVGANWQDLVQHGVVEYPDVHVYLYRNGEQKKRDLERLVAEKPGKGLIFCDSIKKGEKLSEKLDIPFVNGDTPSEDRLDIIRDNRVVIVSRIADEGMSIPGLDWSIEFDFQGSSSRQEMQRVGRPMHGNDNGEAAESDDSDDSEGDVAVESANGLHILQMTDTEFEKHSDRLWGLKDRGFNVQYERRA